MAAVLIRSPDYLPFKLDLANRRVLFVQMPASARADAPFLDERALSTETQGVWLPLDSLFDVDSPLPTHRPDFIFHIGHCGSTLLSRLLQSWPQLQVLREPLPLRTMAAARADIAILPEKQWRALLAKLLERWANPQPPHQRTLIKATSSCNGLIQPILDTCRNSRAVLLDVSLETYLATLLKAEASLRDAAVAAPERLGDLALRTKGPVPALASFGIYELCAMGWLAEQLRFAALAADAEYRAQVLRVDFDRLLVSPRQALGAIAQHFELAGDWLDTALSSAVWSRYSKSQSHAYSAGDRTHDVNLARNRFGAEIAAGRAWVERFLIEHPALTRAELRLD